MTALGYLSPLVPPEWIAAHGFEPRWICPASGRESAAAQGRGVCPFAGAVLSLAELDGRVGLDGLAGLILATTCDQMRYVAASLEHAAAMPVFLFNVPSTWQGDVPRRLYREELERLGRFMVRLGGRSPGSKRLGHIMLDHQRARGAWRAARPGLSAREAHRALIAIRSRGADAVNGYHPAGAACGPVGPDGAGVRLALLGGPLLAGDDAVFDLLESAGGRVVLDATEAGERTLPAEFDSHRLAADPPDELADAYFGHVADIFHRPNHRLYDWLAREVAARRIAGIIVRRYLWCDLWHAEVQRLRELMPAAVLDLDAGPHEHAATGRNATRIEAFLEVLR